MSADTDLVRQQVSCSEARSRHRKFARWKRWRHWMATACSLATLACFCQIANSPKAHAGLVLNEFIQHFEPAHFSLDDLRRQVKRSKRSVSATSSSQLSDLTTSHQTKAERSRSRYQPPINFNLTAHNRIFQVSLVEDAHSVFSPDVTFENTNGPISYDQEAKVYSGFLQDTPRSKVEGIVTSEGLFDGHITTGNGQTYYIEPANRYFKERSNPVDFHSVIYSTDDVLHPAHDGLNAETSCKSHELHLKLKEEHQQRQHLRNKNNIPSTHQVPTSNFHDSISSFMPSVIKQNNYTRSKRSPALSEDDKSGMGQLFEALPESSHMHGGSPVVNLGGQPQSAKKAKAERQTVTTFEIVDWDDVPESVRHHFRKKAEARAAANKANKRFKKINKKKMTCMLYLQADHLFYQEMGSEEASIEAMTRHVQRVNSIYRPMDFDGDGKADNISFMIKRIKVHTTDALKDPNYRFPKNYGVEKFLEIFSEEDYDAFCLAYMFTYRDFEGGTLGLAWTGDLKNAGGVCEKNGHYRGSRKSLNTGIITLLNYGKHVPPAVSHVTMAHEMGHNFGSPHDPENNKACVPGGDNGNYIMFARATSGDKKNNKKFSPCSLKNIRQVLQAKARGVKGCFTEPQMALCGNGVVEEGEECDCGWEEDCEETCCWPQRTTYPRGQTPCTLRPGKICSPTQGPCCDPGCSFKSGDKCRDNNGCRDESFCDGTAAQCPMSVLKPNKTVCNKEFVCYKGECSGSICEAYGMESCQCTQGPDDKDTKACELCCKLRGDDQPCRSSFELNQAPFDVPDMFSKPGTPCNEYRGYCDVFRKCREVDPSGPLATLRKLLFSDGSLRSLRWFFVNHWYAVILIVIGVFLLMAIIVRVCGKKTPLVRRRRRRKVVKHNVDSDIEDVARVEEVVHPAAETALPFGKKVRKSPEHKASKNNRQQASDTVVECHLAGVQIGNRNTTTEENVARANELAGNLSHNLGSPDGGAGARLMGSPAKKKRGLRGKELKRPRSATLISKSFEKLDIISQRRARVRRARAHNDTNDTGERGKKGANHNSDTPAEQGGGGREVTIAQVGKFKFSLEVSSKNKSEDKSEKSGKKHRKGRSRSGQRSNGDKRRGHHRRKKGEASEDEDDDDDVVVVANGSNKSARKHKKKKGGEAAENLAPTAPPSPPAAAVLLPPPDLNKEVILSKKRQLDRPLVIMTPPAAAAAATKPSEEHKNIIKFNRSVSHPGPGPTPEQLEASAASDRRSGLEPRTPKTAPVQPNRTNSFAAAVGRNGSYEGGLKQLRRSETSITEADGACRLGVSRKDTLLLFPQRDSILPALSTGLKGQTGVGGTRTKKYKSVAADSSPSSGNSGGGGGVSGRKGSCLDEEDEEEVESSDEADSDSFQSSEDSKRLSPPTQIQSLSEETSSSAGASSFKKNDSSDEEEESSASVVGGAPVCPPSLQGESSSSSGISRSKILEALEASDPALQKRQRGVHPSTCYEESDSQSQAEGSGGLGFTTEDESVVDRRPQLLPPVPLPRSLAPSTAEFKTANKGMVVGASQDNISILTDGME